MINPKTALGLLRPHTKEQQKLANLFIYLLVLYFNDPVNNSGHTVSEDTVMDWANRREDVQGNWPGPVRSTPTIPQRAYMDRRKPRKISFGIAKALTEIRTRHHRNTSQNRYRVSQFTRRSYKLNIADLQCRNSETDTQQVRHTVRWLCARWFEQRSCNVKWDQVVAADIKIQLKGLLQTRNSPVRTSDFRTEIWICYSPIRNCATNLTAMSSLQGDPTKPLTAKVH